MTLFDHYDVHGLGVSCGDAEAEVKRLRAELETYRRDDRHIVDLRADGWTIQHPMACRPNLFNCPVNQAASRDLTEPPSLDPGQYYCDLADGWFAILDRVEPAEEGADRGN